MSFLGFPRYPNSVRYTMHYGCLLPLAGWSEAGGWAFSCRYIWFADILITASSPLSKLPNGSRQGPGPLGLQPGSQRGLTGSGTLSSVEPLLLCPWEVKRRWEDPTAFTNSGSESQLLPKSAQLLWVSILQNTHLFFTVLEAKSPRSWCLHPRGRPTSQFADDCFLTVSERQRERERERERERDFGFF
jgi:hypothetical protein